MQVVVKTPRIDVKVAGKGINALIRILKKNIPGVQIIDDDTPQNIEDWDYFQKIKARLTPAKVLKIRRENANLTQAALAEKCGIASANIARMETGKRSIGAISAKKLAKALGCDTGDFFR